MFVLAVVAKSCKRLDIGIQCGATETNITAKIIINSPSKENQQNQQKSQKSVRQLVVVPNAADGFQGELDGMGQVPCNNHPAAFVPS